MCHCRVCHKPQGAIPEAVGGGVIVYNPAWPINWVGLHAWIHLINSCAQTAELTIKYDQSAELNLLLIVMADSCDGL